MSGGGTTSTQTSSISPWMEEAAKAQLGKATALTDTTQNPYQQYTGQRISDFTPLQQQAFQGVQNLGTSGAIGQGIDIANQASQRALNTSYTPTTAQNQYRGFEPYQPRSFGNQFQTPDQYQTLGNQFETADQSRSFENQFQTPSQYKGGQFNADRVQAPSLKNYQMQGPADVQSQGYDAATMQAAQTGYNPQLQTFQMGPAERIETQSFAQPGSADAYMSPYMQSVVGAQQREATRASDIQRNQNQAQAVKAGAFGGSRQAIVEAERQRNLGTQLGDIQATGLQAAYQDAQKQFNAEQAARLQAQQSNQQAGLTVGQQNLASQIGTQQLGAGQIGLQTSLANLNSAQQAAVQNQAARNQAMGMNAQQAMQAALANQQAGLTTGQQNLAANLGIQQLGAQQGLQAALANQQYGLNAQQMAEQSRQFGASQGLTAAQLRAQYGLSGQQAEEASRQFASTQAARQAEQMAQYGQSAQQLAEQSRQYGAGLGMQGLQAALSGSSQLGGLGSTQFGQQKDIINAQQSAGALQQAQAQAALSQQYEDFLARQKYPYQQLEFMSNIMRGTPYGTTTSMYSPGPSAASQLLGAGTSLAGAYMMGGGKLFKKGGDVSDAKIKRSSLVDLALSKM